MNTATVTLNNTVAVVTSNRTTVSVREVPVATVYFWLSQWQSVPGIAEVSG